MKDRSADHDVAPSGSSARRVDDPAATARVDDRTAPRVAVIVSAPEEWAAVRQRFGVREAQPAPVGEWFLAAVEGEPRLVCFFLGGWGKIAAAASAQYVLDRFRPELLVNLGTCGGIGVDVADGDVMLVEETVVYDILDSMGAPGEALAHYVTRLDLSWLAEPLPHPVRRIRMLTADRDGQPGELAELRQRYGGVAVDWESGAIAWVAARNGCRCLILRGVSDVVDESGSPTYGDLACFERRAAEVMVGLLDALPDWLAASQG
jgi:adenosylhomocysteine nucleosidase